MTRVEQSRAADEATARPLRKDAARNRAELVRAGRVVFAERGFDASMDDIAREAGVGVGTAYRHFANKHELAEAIFAEAVAEVIGLAEAAAASDDAWTGLVGFIEQVAVAQTADRGLREVLMGLESIDEAMSEQVHDRISAAMRSLVTRGKAQGTVREDLEPADIGMVISMLCGIADLTGDHYPDGWRRYLPLMLAGLQPGGVAFGGPALSEEQMREAMRSHKLRMVRSAKDAGS